jgi:hypothetical protein
MGAGFYRTSGKNQTPPPLGPLWLLPPTETRHPPIEGWEGGGGGGEGGGRVFTEHQVKTKLLIERGRGEGGRGLGLEETFFWQRPTGAPSF